MHTVRLAARRCRGTTHALYDHATCYNVGVLARSIPAGGYPLPGIKKGPLAGPFLAD